MGFWSRLTGWAKKPVPPANVLGGRCPELVILLEEPLHVGIEFVRGAIQHGLGVLLPTGEPNSTEFVTGEFPIFFAQSEGRLLQLKFMPKPYFAAECRPFVNGDPNALRGTVQALGITGEVDRHRGWVSVSFMTAGSRPVGEDPYYYVGKVMSALAFGDVTAIIWPAQGQIRKWDLAMLDCLTAGTPLAIFQ
jgi:hypothetical protein